jgi:hypothetical protein
VRRARHRPSRDRRLRGRLQQPALHEHLRRRVRRPRLRNVAAAARAWPPSAPVATGAYPGVPAVGA